MKLLMITFLLLSSAFAQEVVEGSLFFNSDKTLGSPLNIKIDDHCPRPGQSEGYVDMDHFLEGQEKKSSSRSSEASAQ
jgi:hypothetical protein